MDAIKLIGTSKNGKLTIEIPPELDNKELEIMIISAKDRKPETPVAEENIKNTKEF